jgi:valyl-tRNA synthetase
MVLGVDGRKMSKSLKNYVATPEVLDKYGGDAARQWAAGGGATGSDIPFRWPDVEYAWRFLIKLWNASRFVSDLLEDYTPHGDVEKALQPLDKWILSKCERLTEKVTDALEKCHFNIAIEEIRNFTWHTFCDSYIEAAKDRLYKPQIHGEEKRKAAQYTLHTVLHRVLQLLAPTAPHITEEIYQAIYAESKGFKSIHTSAWPAWNKKRINEKTEKQGDLITAVIAEIRKEKSEKRMPLNAQIKKLTIYAGEKEAAEMILEGEDDIRGACKVENIRVLPASGEGREVKPCTDIRFVAEY